MNLTQAVKTTSLLVAATSMATLFGCANYEVNTKRGDIPGHYIRYELQEADRAVEAARQAGKDKTCPAEFKAAEDAKLKAYDVFRACHTEEGAALAKQATAKAKALCPPQIVKEVPAAAPAPVIVQAPVPVPAPAPAPKPAPKPALVAPSGTLTIVPALITAGGSATLTWSSQNATGCEIQPTIGPVEPQGSLVIMPTDNTGYTLVCKGNGGQAQSAARIAVIAAPAPVMAVAQPMSAPKLCTQTVVNVQFDTQKADLKPRYHDELKKLADFLTEFPDATGVIEGHTDSAGDLASNMKLSQRRADSVRNYLIKNFKIAPERISAKGFGPTKPVADNKTAAGKQKNRRIETNFSCAGK